MTGAGRPLLIGEFARRCRLPVSTLRYYDKIGLLTPAAVDTSSGYRRYTGEQLATAVLISRLRAIGTAPCDIATVVGGGAPAAAVLAAERCRVRAQLRAGRRALAELEDLVNGHGGPCPQNARLVSLTPAAVTAVPFGAPSVELHSAVPRAIAVLRGALRRAGRDRTGPWGAAFPLEITDEVNGFVFAHTSQQGEHRDLRTEWLPATRAVQAVHDAGTDPVAMAYQVAFDLIEDQGWSPVGPVIEEYLALDAAPTATPSIRLTVPIAERPTSGRG